MHLEPFVMHSALPARPQPQVGVFPIRRNRIRRN